MQIKEKDIHAYLEMKRKAEEAKALADGMASELKALMDEAGKDILVVGAYKLSYTDCIRKDIDKKRLESEQKDIHDAYLRESTYKRFSVA